MKRLAYLHIKTKTKNKTRILPQLLKKVSKKNEK
jgi:hypothetical protein|tara:strand:- start:1243 stop:1344 length:102 start_codon:yes stop_codon:yes gene_type:complete